MSHAQVLLDTAKGLAVGRALYRAGQPLPDDTTDPHGYRRAGWSRAWDDAHADFPACGSTTTYFPGAACTRPTGHPLGHQSGRRQW